MVIPDVNVLVFAHRPEAAAHAAARRWLTTALTSPEPVGVSELVLSGFLRIVTNHRVFTDPTPPGKALRFCELVLGGPAARFPDLKWSALPPGEEGVTRPGHQGGPV